MSGKQLTFSMPPPGSPTRTSNVDDTQTSNNRSNVSPPSFLTVLLHQDAISSDADEMHNTGFVMWPSAVMLAHYISSNPSIILGEVGAKPGDILELGSGCGLVGLTAASLLDTDSTNDTDKVIFSDYNLIALENLEKNIELNDFDQKHEVVGMDWFDQQPDGDSPPEKDTWTDMDGASRKQVRLILAADCLVCSNDSDLVAATIDAALIEGGKAIILGADANTRFGVSSFPEKCRELGMNVKVTEDILWENEEGATHDHLVLELEQCGFKHTYDFTMFEVDKPIAAV
mmetsp:Transcript_15572/g.33653  ORF Transcript_15572/g.33653 Transcript_15572/m.33653 type:complete len:287 (-) Transcript_15572:141-1001(-)